MPSIARIQPAKLHRAIGYPSITTSATLSGGSLATEYTFTKAISIMEPHPCGRPLRTRSPHPEVQALRHSSRSQGDGRYTKEIEIVPCYQQHTKKSCHS